MINKKILNVALYTIGLYSIVLLCSFHDVISKNSVPKSKKNTNITIANVVDIQHKELHEPMVMSRDPFCWVEKPVIKVAKKTEKKPSEHRESKKVEIKQELPWHACGVSITKDKQCALFSNDNETKVVHLHQEVCSNWKVERISLSSVHVKHSTGESREFTI